MKYPQAQSVTALFNYYPNSKKSWDSARNANKNRKKWFANLVSKDFINNRT